MKKNIKPIITALLLSFAACLNAAQHLSIKNLIDRKQLPTIENNVLNLSNKKLTSAKGLSHIHAARYVHYIDLSFNNIKNISANDFTYFTRLKEIDLDNNPLSNKEIKKLRSALPNVVIEFEDQKRD